MKPTQARLDQKVTESERTEGDAPARRPYEKPSFVNSMAFERASLTCAGNRNTASGPPSFCDMTS